MIGSFRHKGLSELFITGKSRKVSPHLWERAIRRLDVLQEGKNLGDLNQPGFNFHSLRGGANRYTMHVNGPWCITFEWIEDTAYNVDLVQYH